MHSDQGIDTPSQHPQPGRNPSQNQNSEAMGSDEGIDAGSDTPAGSAGEILAGCTCVYSRSCRLHVYVSIYR